jgi:hypothetical protein
MDTIGLSDAVLRAPFLLSGTLTLVLIPLVVRRWLGAFVSATLAWLLSLSPLLVFFSRYARPYAITLLCAFGGAFAFLEWWTTGRRRWALAFGALAVLTGCLLVIELPFVLGGFAFALAETIRRRPGPPSPGRRGLAWLGFLVCAALCILLLTALITDFYALSGRFGPAKREGFTAAQLYGAFEVLAGDAGPWASRLLGLLAVLGALRGLRVAPRFVGYLLTLSALQAGAIFLTIPAGIAWRLVLARYLLPVLPVLLMLVALGLEALAVGLRRWRVGGALAASVAASVFLAGPIPRVLGWANDWVAQQFVVEFWYGREGYARVVRRVPEFYRGLAELPPGSLSLIEVPSYIFSQSNPLGLYQSVHRQRDLVGFHNGLCGRLRKGEVPWGRRGIAFRNYVFLADPRMVKTSGARYVVFHRRMTRETLYPPTVLDEPDLSNCIAAFRARYGAPTFEDPDIVAFDLGGSAGAGS